MTDHATLDRFIDLIDAGFSIQEITSTNDHVILELADGARRTVLELGPDDVQPFLGARDLERIRRVPAGTR